MWFAINWIMTFPGPVNLFMVSSQAGVELAFYCKFLWALFLFVYLFFK